MEGVRGSAVHLMSSVCFRFEKYAPKSSKIHEWKMRAPYLYDVYVYIYIHNTPYSTLLDVYLLDSPVLSRSCHGDDTSRKKCVLLLTDLLQKSEDVRII